MRRSDADATPANGPARTPSTSRESRRIRTTPSRIPSNSGVGVFDEEYCPFRDGARHPVSGKCRANLRHELARPNVSLSRPVLPAGVARVRYRARCRGLYRLEIRSRPSLNAVRRWFASSSAVTLGTRFRADLEFETIEVTDDQAFALAHNRRIACGKHCRFVSVRSVPLPGRPVRSAWPGMVGMAGAGLVIRRPRRRQRLGRQRLGMARGQRLCRADLPFRIELPTLELNSQGVDEDSAMLIDANASTARAPGIAKRDTAEPRTNADISTPTLNVEARELTGALRTPSGAILLVLPHRHTSLGFVNARGSRV
jgi:hypothetical protein